MEHMYQQLVKGKTVAQALRLAMLHLACRPMAEQLPQDQDLESVGHSEVNKVPDVWRKPKYWAAFLVMGATTRLLHLSQETAESKGVV